MFWNPKEKPEAWNYLLNVAAVFDNLGDTINELQMTTSLIEKLDHLTSLTNQNNSITLKYLIKNWIGRYVSIYEISLCLINEVLELGYMGNTRTKGNLERNSHIKENIHLEKIRKKIGSLVKIKLKGTEKEIECLNNKAKHEGELSHKSISDLLWFKLQQKWELYDDEINFEIDQGLLIHSNAKELNELNEKMANAVIELLDYLDPIYEQRFAELRK